MIKFRHQRGSYEESMQTLQTFETIEELKNILNDAYHPPIKYKKLTISYYWNDPRNNWGDTYIVCLDGNGVGYTDGVPAGYSKCTYEYE